MSDHRPKRSWTALTNAWDTSGITVAALLWLLPGMTTTDANLADPSLPIIMRLSIGLAGWLALAGVLLVAEHGVVIRLHGTARRVAVLTAYGLGATARVLVVAALTSGWSMGADASLSWIPVRWVSTVIWLNATAIVMSWHRRNVLATQRLEAERQRAELTRAQLAEAYAATQRQLNRVRESVRASIADVIAHLQAPLDEQRAISITADLRRASDDLVRPTSHELAQAPDAPARPPAPVLSTRRLRDQILGTLRAWPTAGPFRWWATVGIGAPITIAALLSYPTQRATGILVAGLAAQLAVLGAAALVLPPVLHRLPWLPGLTIVIGVYATMLVVGTTFTNAASSANEPISLEVRLLPTLVAMLAAGAIAFDTSARDAERATAEVVAEMEWTVVRAHQQLWAERRRLAVTLHGQVQAALTACVALMDQWMDGAVTLSAAALTERVRLTLQQAIDLDETKHAHPTFAKSLDELISTWAGVIEIEASVSAAATAALDADADGCYAATEAVREVVLNAVRHSHATRVMIAAGLSDERVVELVVTSQDATVLPDRRDPTRATAPVIVDRRGHDRGTAGIGLSLLDSIAMSWTTVESAGRRKTTLRIPTGGTAAAEAARASGQ